MKKIQVKERGEARERKRRGKLKITRCFWAGDASGSPDEGAQRPGANFGQQGTPSVQTATVFNDLLTRINPRLKRQLQTQ